MTSFNSKLICLKFHDYFSRRVLLSLLVFLLFTVLSRPSMAMMFTSGEVYFLTKKTCSAINPNDLDYSITWFNNETGFRFYSVNYFQKILDEVKYESFKTSYYNFLYFEESPTANFVLQDEYFNKALNECFPNAENSKKYFKNQIKNAVYEGKKLSALVQAAGFIGGGAAIGQAIKAFPKLSPLLSRITIGTTAISGISIMTSDSVPNKTIIKITDIVESIHQNSQYNQKNSNDPNQQINSFDLNKKTDSGTTLFLTQLIPYLNAKIVEWTNELNSTHLDQATKDQIQLKITKANILIKKINQKANKIKNQSSLLKYSEPKVG